MDDADGTFDLLRMNNNVEQEQKACPARKISGVDSPVRPRRGKRLSGDSSNSIIPFRKINARNEGAAQYICIRTPAVRATFIYA